MLGETPPGIIGTMKDIPAPRIVQAVAEACIRANYELPSDVEDAIEKAIEAQQSAEGIDVLKQLLENARVARTEGFPICQDTGLVVVFVELGQDARVVDGLLPAAIQEGVRRGYEQGYLRKSVVQHPLDRLNTGDNTPAIIHYKIVSGDGLRIVVAPKGAGSENMSALKMLKPSDGVEGVRRFVVETVIAAGANPCPPIVVGVGLGGSMEMAALLAKKALLRTVGSHSSNSTDAALEKELLDLVNRTGIGPSGLGGRVTALAVHVESHPCHIASLPVAVNLQCHAARHVEVRL